MEQCQILREYAIYVARVRKYAKYMQLETAVQKAVDECIQEEILEEFLRKNRAEVIAVSIFEYDKEEEERKLREAEFEAGEQSTKWNTKRNTRGNTGRKGIENKRNCQFVTSGWNGH